jgi:hypothetical protein
MFYLFILEVCLENWLIFKLKLITQMLIMISTIVKKQKKKLYIFLYAFYVVFISYLA